MGLVCYADDVLLIAPTSSAMQRMLEEMENFAEEFNVVFRTNDDPRKSKCIYDVGRKTILPHFCSVPSNFPMSLRLATLATC